MLQLIACLGMVVLLGVHSAIAKQTVADTIVTHGKILTVDANFHIVEALAITDGRIVATGTSAEVARYKRSNTKVIDVEGATVVPGLIGNHFHFTRAVETWHEQARFEGVDSRHEALRILSSSPALAAARAGWHVHQHVINNNAVSDLLDTLEQVNRTQPLNGLRWTLGHVYDISPTNIARAKALGMTLGVHGAAMQAGAHMPLRLIADSGIVFGLGTDATIVSHTVRS